MLIILGLGSASKIAFGFAEALFPILIASAAAASQIDPRLLWSAEGLGLSAPRPFRASCFPPRCRGFSPAPGSGWSAR